MSASNRPHSIDSDLPWVEVKPIVRNFNLVSVNNFLTEDAVAVTKSVAPGRIVQSCERVEETSGKTTKATVAQCCISFLLDDVLHAESKVTETL